MYPNLNPNPMQAMNFPTGQLVNSAPTQSPFQANMSAQIQPNPQQPQQNFKRGGQVKNSYVAAHFSKKELDALDHLQGGSERHNKTGIRSYKGLEALLKNPHLLKLIHEHSTSHHAEGGSIQGMAHNGRHGDTEMAFIGPHTRQLLDKLAGHKTRNPYDGHPEYFSLGKMLGGIGKTIMRVPKGIIKGVGNLSPAARGMLGTAASAIALPIMGPAAAALPFIAKAAPNFLKHIKGFAGKAKSSVNDLKNQANSMLGQAQEYGQNMYGKAQDKAQGMYDQAINYGQQAQNEAQNMYGQAQEYGQNMYGKAQDKAQGMYDQAINYGQQAQNEAQNMYGRAQEYGQNMYNQGQQAYGNARNQAKGYGQDIYNQAQGMGNQYALQGRQMYNQGRDQMNQMGQQAKEMYNQYQQQPSYQPYSYYQ
jgi:vacuolar-type H+-ATPase subunit H